MSVTRNEIEYIAELARLKFSDDELESLTLDMNRILDYMDKLNELDTENVEPLSHPLELENVFREDKIGKSISAEDALKNSFSRSDKYFTVPKVIKVNSK
ncbi:MAG: Asp-tRNA(Asn)/Glu-tRNA(Gln) amidotransferase subunit GatC [Melioribacteraceae bacterium]|nr:Asp-tRNA(Asn)/Glu-tRNA(Gln) amidotransferase subunit GatC [Melioribacteraceae bacterium]